MTTNGVTAAITGAPPMSPEEAMDPSIRPQDDLYRFINGRFLRDHVIPPDRARDGVFMRLRDLSEERVRALITEAAEAPDTADEARQIGDLYSSFMDTERLEALGAEPLQEDLAAIAASSDKTALAQTMARLADSGVTSSFALFVDVDFNDPDAYTVYVWQSGLGLPDESYYREAKYAEIRHAYVSHVAAILQLSNVVSPAATHEAASRVMAVETRLAEGHWDAVKSREADLLNNPMSWPQLRDLAPGFPWEEWRTALNAPADALDRVIVAMPSYLTHMARVWQEMDLESLRSWLAWQAAHARAPYLSEDFAAEHFDFYGRTLTGTTKQRDRWKRGVALVEGAMGEAVGKLYVERHFPPGHKAAMQQLVDNLIEAYRQSISTLDWMGPATRERALAKLAAFTAKIGYPDKWRDYSALHISATDLVGNVRAAHQFETQRNFAKLGKPVDRSEWFMPPQMVNAYYNPTMNEIVFPAAILQPPFFDVDADDAWNYGAIGAVIGHEIGHGFDDQGSKYDGQGRLHDWWTDEDRAEFDKRTQALIEQYNAFWPAQLDESHPVNGELTVGENIGDLGGLTIAIKAYELALQQQGYAGLAEAPVIDGLTGLQRVFYSWARIWQQKARDEEVIRLLAIDPHSPNEFRCNGVVRNLDSFVEAFDVREGDALYLPPEQRVRIW